MVCVTFLMIAGFSLSACVHVAPYQREDLARAAE